MRWLRFSAFVVVSMASVSTAQAADPACPFGVNAHQASSQALTRAAEAGVAWVRFDANWWQLEPARDAYDWSIPDRFVADARERGLNVVMTLAYTPPWAASVPCNDADPNEANWCTNAPANVDDWTDFVEAVVTRYRADVRHYGLWNEPNLAHFYRGERDQWVIQVLRPGSRAVKAACPDCKVLGPELAGLAEASWDADSGECVGPLCTFNGWNHSLARILDDAGDAIDIVTHHTYADPAGTWWERLVDGEFIGIQVRNGVKEVTDEHAPDHEVWLTEFGWQTSPGGPHDPDYAADQLRTAYEGLWAVHRGDHPGVVNQPWPALSKLFWYDLHDDPSGPAWGLLTADLRPKPAFAAMTETIAALGCVLPQVDGGDTGGEGGSGDGGPGDDGEGEGGTGGGATDGAGPGEPTAGAGSGAAMPGGSAAGCRCTQPSPRGGPIALWLAVLVVLRHRA